MLTYSGLVAVDARGEPLPAWLEIGDGSLFVYVDDAGATYPLTIDPWVQTAKLTASDGMGARDSFGGSVAVDGDTVVVGAKRGDIGGNTNQGSAYVFVKPGGGWANMTETAKLTASDGVAGDEFGHSVAIDDDTVVVGAVDDDSLRGSAYVFVKPGGGSANLTETAKLTASDGAANDYFGSSVAIDDDALVVGALADESYQGSAYIFVTPGGGWAATTETAKLTASDGAAWDTFGSSVAMSGGTVIVGAYGDDSCQGSAYVFVKPGGGWASGTETAKLTASDGAVDDRFGGSVAISGGTAIVGAGLDNVGANDRQGSAYIFVKPGAGWAAGTETAKLTASDGAVDDRFGGSAAISGGTVIVGAYGDESYEGSAYVYWDEDLTPPTPDPMTWSTVPHAIGPNAVAMTATTATDPSSVEYFFDETSGNPGGSDSGWQDSATYTDTGLTEGTEYAYRVQARDKSPDLNETGLFAVETATPGVVETAATFRVDLTGGVFADGTFAAAAFETGSADVAEWVPVSEPVEAGDVLALDPDHPGAYRLSRTACSPLVAGVVASPPGVLLGVDVLTGAQALLALVGIVPTKVTDEGGPILPGDLLVSSSTSGHAMRWDGGGSPALIGKALEPMSDTRGLILVLLTSH